MVLTFDEKLSFRNCQYRYDCQNWNEQICDLNSIFYILCIRVKWTQTFLGWVHIQIRKQGYQCTVKKFPWLNWWPTVECRDCSEVRVTCNVTKRSNYHVTDKACNYCILDWKSFWSILYQDLIEMPTAGQIYNGSFSLDMNIFIE